MSSIPRLATDCTNVWLAHDFDGVVLLHLLLRIEAPDIRRWPWDRHGLLRGRRIEFGSPKDTCKCTPVTLRA